MANNSISQQKKVRAAERRPLTLDLRKAGYSYRAIAARLDISEAQAHRDVAQALKTLQKREQLEIEDLRRLELERCDRMLQGAWPFAEAGSAPHIAVALKVSERRAKLLGLDAPRQVNVQVMETITQIVRLVEEQGGDASELFNKMLARLADGH